jgi:UMF1 family MFS transporter
MNTKQNIFLWSLYDFANSIVYISLFLYFSQWLVVDSGVADFWYNLTFTISALFLLMTVPTTGLLLDKYWRRIAGLRFSTITTFIFYLLTAIFAILNQPILSLIFSTFGLYFYLLSFTFYTPLLNDLSQGGNKGRVSGYGIMANYLGQITGILISLPFATGYISFFGQNPRVEVLLPGILIFFLLSLPVLIYFKEAKKPFIKFSILNETKNSFKELKSLLSYKSVGLFLLVFFFFNDAVLTAANNFSIFLEQVWQVSDSIKSAILVGILLTSAIGAILSGIVSDKIGHKKTMMGILIGWLVLLPFIALATNFWFFVGLLVVMGIWLGASWTTARTIMGDIAPKEKHNSAFAYFGLTERVSALFGPLVWGMIVTGLADVGPDRYRIAVVSITVFILIAIFFMRKVEVENREE